MSDRFNGLLKSPEAHGVAGLGRGNEFGRVWWLASSKELNMQLERPRSNSFQKSVMYGLADTVARKGPVRLQKLRRSVDARIRATGMYADDNMTELRTYLLNRHKHVDDRTKKLYAIIDEGTRLPQDGIDFDLPPEQHRQMTKSLLSSVRRLHINT